MNHPMKRFSGLFCVALLAGIWCSLTLTAFAGESVQIEGVTITAQDITQLLNSLHTALSPDDKTIHLVVSLKKTGEMPTYDRRWHYAGMTQVGNGTPTLSVWINSDLAGSAQENAIASAFMIALTDGGYGGPSFKKLYDFYASKDAQLPADATDPYLNRHRFADALAKMLSP